MKKKTDTLTDSALEMARRNMVATQLVSRDIRDSGVLEAMEKVQRHEFLSEEHWSSAYGDHPLPIGYGQTISQPYIVAYMTQAIVARAGNRILEVGTGCGYQSAVLSEIGCEVHSIEILEPLVIQARKNLKRLGYDVDVALGDGKKGRPDRAPFDGIIVTAAPDRIPDSLPEQLRDGGRLVIPVGTLIQDLKIFVKEKNELKLLYSLPVRFVPLV